MAKNFCPAFFLLLIFQAVPVPAAPGDAAAFEQTRLGERVLVFYQAPWAETMTVVDAGSALLVIDTWGSLAAATRARVQAEDFFGKKVGFVVNTHHHWDHAFGNAAFAGAEIIGHRYCAEDMQSDYADTARRRDYFAAAVKDTPQPELREYIRRVGQESDGRSFALVPPRRLIGDRGRIRAGNLTVLLFAMPGIHTRSNLAVFIPELGILAARREFADPAALKLEPGADPGLLAAVLEEILARKQPVRYLVSGHGKPLENPDLRPAIARLRP